ncbi:B12-binding domain-containing radical SAM protein [Candidatus Beckwithbacteria bacterium]|nr:B12-binding domain-containing radical SAM protein [Candidatus Beckwithbacteria bacterium]
MSEREELTIPGLQSFLRIERENRPHLARPLNESNPEVLGINVPATFPCLHDGNSAEFLSHRSIEEPPFGFLRVITAAREQGVKAMFMDAHKLGLSLGEIIHQIAVLKPSSIALNPTSVNLQEASVISQQARAIGIPVILGGVHATLDSDRALLIPGVRAVIRGHGEKVLPQVVKALLNQEKTEIPGVSTEEYCSHDFAETMPLEDVPLIDPSIWLEKPLSRYETTVWGEKRIITQAEVYFTRSCPYGCSFCASSALNPERSFVRPSMKRLVAEIKLNLAIGADALHILDDNVVLNQTHLGEVSEALREAEISDLVWKGLSRVGTLKGFDNAGYDLLKKSGCYHLAIGFESGNKELLRRMRKGFEPSDAMTVAQELASRKIGFKGMFIIGSPLETEQQIKETIEMIFRLQEAGMTDLAVFQWKPYPGTEDTAFLCAQKPEFAHILASQIEDYQSVQAGEAGSMLAYRTTHDKYLPDNWPPISELPNNEIRQLIEEIYRKFYS